MKKALITAVILCGIIILTTAGCGKKTGTENFDAGKKIDTIIKNGPQTSSNPFDYVKASQKEYDELLKHPKETFEYSIKELIETDAGLGLKSYIEALLCQEINRNFEYDFETAKDYLENYKNFLENGEADFNSYDEYSKTLIDGSADTENSVL